MHVNPKVISIYIYIYKSKSYIKFIYLNVHSIIKYNIINKCSAHGFRRESPCLKKYDLDANHQWQLIF